MQLCSDDTSLAAVLLIFFYYDEAVNNKMVQVWNLSPCSLLKAAHWGLEAVPPFYVWMAFCEWELWESAWCVRFGWGWFLCFLFYHFLSFRCSSSPALMHHNWKRKWENWDHKSLLLIHTPAHLYNNHRAYRYPLNKPHKFPFHYVQLWSGLLFHKGNNLFHLSGFWWHIPVGSVCVDDLNNRLNSY